MRQSGRGAPPRTCVASISSTQMLPRGVDDGAGRTPTGMRVLSPHRFSSRRLLVPPLINGENKCLGSRVSQAVDSKEPLAPGWDRGRALQYAYPAVRCGPVGASLHLLVLKCEWAWCRTGHTYTCYSSRLVLPRVEHVHLSAQNARVARVALDWLASRRAFSHRTFASPVDVARSIAGGVGDWPAR